MASINPGHGELQHDRGVIVSICNWILAFYQGCFPIIIHVTAERTPPDVSEENILVLAEFVPVMALLRTECELRSGDGGGRRGCGCCSGSGTLLGNGDLVRVLGAARELSRALEIGSPWVIPNGMKAVNYA